MMRLRPSGQVALFILLSVCSATGTLATLSWCISRLDAEPNLLRCLVEQRDSAQNLLAWAKMVHAGQQEDRKALEQLVFQFDRAVDSVERRRDDTNVVFFPRGASAIQGHFAALHTLWRRVRPGILLMSQRPVDSQQSKDTYELVESTVPRIIDTATQLILETETQHREHEKWLITLMVAGVSLNLGILYCGAWLVYRHRLKHERDVTLLGESEKRFLALMASVPDAVIIADQDGTILTLNRSAEIMFGYTAGEALGKSALMLVPKRHEHIYQNHIGQVRATGTSELVEESIEANALRKDGTEIPVEVTAGAWAEGGKMISGVIVRDITQRVRSQQERSRLALAVEQTSEAIMITERDGTIVYVNPAFEQVTGYRHDEVLGRNPRILKSGKQDGAFYRQMWATLAGGGVWASHFINRRKDGSLYEEEAVISPVRDTSGEVTNYVAVKRDVTKEVLLEAQFRQAQKMEAVGRLAGGVAHDFNNLLTAIMGYGQMMKHKVSPDDPASHDAEEILKAAARGASLTRQLLLFSRQQVVELQVLDLNETIAGVDKMLRRLVGEDIDLVTAPAAGSQYIRADAGQLEQVLMNLAINARDAMSEGGKLTIETGTVELDAIYAETHLNVQPGRYAMLAVSDTGTGMTPEVKAHLFEPFFTTKDAGKGTGLGLSIVHGIVSKSGGHVDVYTHPGQGTTFKIYLPLTEQTAGDLSSRSAELGPCEGSEIVLLVEDEEPLRRLMRDSLALHGYTVLEARDGSEAIGICERPDQTIDLLVTDVVMPLMNGPDLARRVELIRPDLRVLFISGYTDRALVHQGRRGRATAFLQKPFMPEALARKVRGILDQPLQDAA